jgi:large subunit ribosomal protein L27
MAHKKAGGSSKNGRDSNPQYRGVKLYAGQKAKGGSIIVRQCGSHFHPGVNVGMGKDFTLFAKQPGIVVFIRRGLQKRCFIDVVSPAKPELEPKGSLEKVVSKEEKKVTAKKPKASSVVKSKAESKPAVKKPAVKKKAAETPVKKNAPKKVAKKVSKPSVKE